MDDLAAPSLVVVAEQLIEGVKKGTVESGRCDIVEGGKEGRGKGWSNS